MILCLLILGSVLERTKGKRSSDSTTPWDHRSFWRDTGKFELPHVFELPKYANSTMFPLISTLSFLNFTNTGGSRLISQLNWVLQRVFKKAADGTQLGTFGGIEHESELCQGTPRIRCTKSFHGSSRKVVFPLISTWILLISTYGDISFRTVSPPFRPFQCFRAMSHTLTLSVRWIKSCLEGRYSCLAVISFL